MKTLSAFLIATSMLAGACVDSTKAPPRRPAEPIVRPIDQPPERIDRAALRAALAERRQAVYERFLAYRENRVYPINDVSPGFQHVWLDSQGNLCAAATLISADWGRDATVNVSRENNAIALADVHDGALHDWVLTSGLTHHELVAIQVPGWEPNPQVMPEPPRSEEVERLYALYVDVERQLTSMWDLSLDEATDALIDHPALARAMIRGVVAGPGKYAMEPSAPRIGFAQPPP